MGGIFATLYQGRPYAVPKLTAGSGTVTSTSTGGTIAAGTVVSVKVSVTLSTGSAESEAVQVGQLTVPAGTSTNKVTVTWPVSWPPGTYNVYAGTPGSEKLVATNASPGGFVWTGTAGTTDPPAAPGDEITATPGLYSPPTGYTAVVTEVLASNPGYNDAYLYLSRVRAGGTGGAANRIIGGTKVFCDANPPSSRQAEGPLRVRLSQPLGVGDFLTGLVTRPEVVVTINGLLFPVVG